MSNPCIAALKNTPFYPQTLISRAILVIYSVYIKGTCPQEVDNCVVLWYSNISDGDLDNSLKVYLGSGNLLNRGETSTLCIKRNPQVTLRELYKCIVCMTLVFYKKKGGQVHSPHNMIVSQSGYAGCVHEVHERPKPLNSWISTYSTLCLHMGCMQRVWG